MIEDNVADGGCSRNHAVITSTFHLVEELLAQQQLEIHDMGAAAFWQIFGCLKLHQSDKQDINLKKIEHMSILVVVLVYYLCHPFL